MRYRRGANRPLPLTIGAAHFWFVRRGFYFTGAGAELPLAWSVMLMVQALLGDGAYAVAPASRWHFKPAQAQALL